MQIVINIDDWMYSEILKGVKYQRLEHNIKNGTPLPKGHGRLIDADERRTEIDEEYRWVVDLAPTIIESEGMRIRDECIDYKKQGHCEWTDCRECHYQNICDEWESEY